MTVDGSDYGDGLTVDGGDVDGDVAALTQELLAEFRALVNAAESTVPDAQLTTYLEHAKLMVDRFCAGTIGIDAALFHSWYKQVGAELFDRDKGPAATFDRFDNVVTQRSTRNPLQVVLREMRLWVPSW